MKKKFQLSKGLTDLVFLQLVDLGYVKETEEKDCKSTCSGCIMKNDCHSNGSYPKMYEISL